LPANNILEWKGVEVTNTLDYYNAELMEQHVFQLPLVIDGATEEESQVMMTLMSIYNKKLSFNEQY
jgi:hypothetical protein